MGFLELGPALALPVCHTGSSEELESSPEEITISGFCAGVEVIGVLTARPFSFFTSLVTLSVVWTLPILAGSLVFLLSGALLGTEIDLAGGMLT